MGKLILDPNDLNADVSDPINDVRGNSGTESIHIDADSTLGVTVNINVERIDLPGAVADFLYQQTGGHLYVYSGTSLVADIMVQADGTEIVFTDGSVIAELNADFTMSLGGRVIPDTAPGAVEPIDIDPATTSNSDLGTVVPPTPEFSIEGNLSVVEGNTATYTITLSQAQGTATTVDFAVTGTGGAVAGTDTGAEVVAGTGITVAGSTITFAPGATTATITVPVNFDSDAETGEGFTVTLSNPSAGTDITTSESSVATSIENPPAPEFTLTSSVASNIATEEGHTITYTITPSSITDKAYSFSLATTGLANVPGTTAAEAADFTPAGFQVNFAAGQTAPITITQTVVGDTASEGLQAYSTVLLDENLAELTHVNGLINDSTVDIVERIMVLTTGPDAGDNFTGRDGADTFIATETTLSSNDVLVGGNGIDTLKYSSSGNADVNEAGFEASEVEIVQVTADVVPAAGPPAVLGITNFDVTGVSDVTTLINDNSSGDLVFLGIDAIPDVTLRNLGGAGIASDVDTTLTFNAGVVAGTSDELDVTLDNNMNVDATRVGDLTANGIEVFNVTTTGNGSLLNELASNTLIGMTVAGDEDLSLAAANFFNTVDVNTVDASAFEGDLSIVLSNSGFAGIDVAVTGGIGDDRADFSNGFDVEDEFTGGEGTDTLVLTNATAIALTTLNGGTLAEVEQLELSTPGTGTIDMDVFPGVNRVIYDAGITDGVATTVDDAVTGITVEVDVTAAGTGNLTVDLVTDGAADTVSIALDDLAAGDAIGTITADDAETLNISADDDSIAGTGNVTIANLAITDTTVLNLAGDADIIIAAATNPATPVLGTVDASAATGDLNITGLNLRATGATVTLGSGDDIFTVATANGADAINLALGGEDTVVYNATAQSDRDMDTITGFSSGDDIVDVRALMGGVGVASSVQFVGNRSSFALAQGALTGGGIITAVFDQSESILWVDFDANGTLDNNDFRVMLDDVTSITAADLGFIAGVTFTANVAAFNTAVAANSIENNAVGTEDDTINATVAQLAGATVNGSGGVDALNISGTVAAGEIADLRTIGFTNVETVVLASTAEGLDMDTADLGAGQVVTITGAAGVLQSLAINAGSDISGVAITNIETLNLAGGVTMTIAQHNGFGAINAPGGADGITFTTGGTAVTGDADIEAYTLAGTTTNDFTVGAAAQWVTAPAGAVDTVRAGALAITGTYVAQAADTLIVTNGSVISGANAGAALGFGTLNLTGAVTMTEAQHDSFIAASGIVAAGGADTVNILTGAIASIVTDADVETYVIQDDTGDDGFTVTINGAAQTITSSASGAVGDTVTFDFGAGALTFTGSITGEGTGDDILSLATGADLTGATLAAIEDLTLANNASVTLDADDWDAFETGGGLTLTAGGNEILNLAGAITDTNVDAHANIENYVLLNTGNDQITFTLVNAAVTAFTIDVNAASGDDTVVLNNFSIDTGTSVVTVAEFDEANDRIGSQINGTSIVTGAFVNADAGNKVTGQIGGNVIHMNSTGVNGVSIAAPLVDGSMIAALNQVMTNGGAVADIADGNYTVIGYNGDNAYIYHLAVAGGDGAVVGDVDDTVELVGVLNNVGADSLTAVNFV